MRKLLHKLVQLENKDGSEIYMMMFRGIIEIEVDIKVKRSIVPSQQNSLRNEVQERTRTPTF